MIWRFKIPYENEHACVVNSAAKVVGSMTKKSDGKEIRILVGKLPDQDKSTTHSIRYPVKDWTAAEARAHCREHEGKSFEAAKGKDQEFTDPLDNDFIRTEPED